MTKSDDISRFHELEMAAMESKRVMASALVVVAGIQVHVYTLKPAARKQDFQ